MNRIPSLLRSLRPALSCRQLTKGPRLVRLQAVTLNKSYSTSLKDDSTEPPPSRFPVPAINTLPEDIQARINEVQEKSGFIPNVFKALAYRPEEFRAFFSYYDALMEKKSDTLTKAEKEMIVVVTSSYNDCLYCVVAHGALHRIYSKNKYVSDQLAVNFEAADISDREKAITTFAMALCKASHISDSQIEELKTHGLTDDDVWDVGAITALFSLSNRMAHLTRMRPNPEFNIMGRIKHDKKN